MANDFKNTDLVVKFMIKAFLNELQLAKKVDRQVDDKNIYEAKVGPTIRIRRPVYFTASDGAEIEAGETSDIEEGTVSLTLNKRKKVVMSIPTVDETLRVEDGYERYIVPAAQELAQQVETDLATDIYKGTYNFVGTPGTQPSNFLAVANAKAKLSELGVSYRDRYAFYSPTASINLADGLKGAFPEKIARTAIEEAAIGRYAGFDIYENQSLALHTVGVNTGTPLVNGANQNVTYLASKDTWTQTLNTDGWTNSQTGILKAGDVFTIAGVNSVNRRTRTDTGNLAQFVVTADADSGAATGPAALTISPPIIISGPFQTVTAAPADDAAITVQTGTGGSSYRQNIGFHKNACTLAFARLVLPDDGTRASRMTFDGISMRVIRKYNDTTDQTRTRIDILYGIKMQNPGFAVRTTS